MPRLKQYTGTMDLLEHLHYFRKQMAMYIDSDILICRVFPPTLEQGAFEWFQRPPTGSISSFDRLTKHFLRNYPIRLQERHGVDSLFEVTMDPRELFKDYVDRFKAFLVWVKNPDQHLVLTAFSKGFC